MVIGRRTLVDVPRSCGSVLESVMNADLPPLAIAGQHVGSGFSLALSIQMNK